MLALEHQTLAKIWSTMRNRANQVPLMHHMPRHGSPTVPTLLPLHRPFFAPCARTRGKRGGLKHNGGSHWRQNVNAASAPAYKFPSQCSGPSVRFPSSGEWL